MHLLVTRPLPAAETTAARLRALGHKVTLAPLLDLEARDWSPPARAPTAIMLTSAAAARLAGPAAAAFHALPTFAVGTATAAAARAAGFTAVTSPAETVQALLDHLAVAAFRHILHLAGTDRTPAAPPAGLIVTTRIVYSAHLMPLAATPNADFVLLYSPRTAAHFAAETDRLGHPRHRIAVAALSAAVAAAAGPGWRAVAVAARPTEDALLAAISATCQTPPGTL